MNLTKIFSIIVLLSVVCFAEQLIDKQSVLNESQSVTIETYPNADEVILHDYTQVSYNPDGTAIEVSEGYTKILTEKAKRSNQTVSYNFTIPYNEIDVSLVEIIKPDGQSVTIDVESEGKVMIDRSQMSSNIYNPNDKIFQVSISGIEIGDILHTSVTTKIVKPRMVDSWSDYQVFEYTSPIKNLVYEIIAPKEKPLESIALKDKQGDTVTYTSSETDDAIIHKWTVKDIDMIYPEPDMPAFWTTVQRLLVSTNPDWPSVSRWYWELSKPHLEANEEMKAKCRELISGIEDKDEQMRAIFKFVSQDIRYLGITVEKEAPGYEPHDASMTFANRHGVCRDKAALLVAMLRASGFQAYPVLIYSGPKKDEEVPQPYFNHAISAVKDDDGSFILMDSTDESTQELLPAYLNDCSYLVATPEGTQLMVSPIEPAEDNMMDIETTAEVSIDGRYKAQSTLIFEGINDNAYRGFFLRSSPEQRRQYFEAVVKRLLPGANLTSFELKPDNLQDTAQTITANLSYQADNVIIDDGEMGAASIYNIGAKVGMVNFVLGKTGLEKRRFPLETGFACGVKEHYSLKVAEGMEIVSLPQYQNIEDDTMVWKRSVSQEENIVKADSEFKLTTVRFSPQQYLALKSHLADIEYNEARKLILHKMEETPDAVIELNDTHYSLTDKHNWKTSFRIRIRVLTYKGKKDLSEIKFNYNPAWEELAVLSAKVETAGEVKEISNEEINIMDAAWAGSAPRYPAGKTLVASLPGVEIGSIIEYEIEKTSTDKPFFAVTEIFGDYYPIKEKNVRITMPADLEYDILEDQNGLLIPDDGMVNIKTSHSETATTKSIEWQGTNIDKIERETSQPPSSGISPVLSLTTGTWQEYTAKLKKIIERFEMTREVKMYSRKAEELTKYASDDIEKIQQIRDFIAKSIRPVGASFTTMPLTSLTKPDITLVNGYGNHMDRAILTAAMLRYLGMDASIILASGGSRLEEFEQFRKKTPDTSSFSIPLVKVVAEGETYYLGDTDQYAALGSTASDKHLYLSLNDAKIDRVNVSEDMISRIDNHYRIKADSDGAVWMEAEEYSYGIYHGISNKKYEEMPPEQTRRYYQELVGQISQAARADGKLTTNFEEYPGKEQYSIIMSRYAIIDDAYLYFELPPVLPSLPDIREDSRQTPYYNSGYMRYKTTLEVQLPDGYEPVLLPVEGKKLLPANGGTITITQQTEDDKITIVYQIDLRPSVIMPEICPQYSDAVSWLNNKDKKFIMLRKK
ncbi:MAG: DUF3857 domain-containing protein [Sedimentisphaeraceae bacterium JB056]